MTNILDDINVRRQRDPSDALGIAVRQFEQVLLDVSVKNKENDGRKIANVVVTGMGGSALAALILKSAVLSDLELPFDIVRNYDLPAYVGKDSLVVVSSYSGNTEETISALDQARAKGSQIAILSSGGKLIDFANEHNVAHVVLPSGTQPRMATLYGLKGLVSLLVNFGVVEKKLLSDIEQLSGWLSTESSAWHPDNPTDSNYAKQLAHDAIGKIPVFYGSAITAPIAYKWKISWNETAKNVAFCNEFPEFNHNEFMGWVAHPVEKPFAVFDIKSSFDHPRITKRFELSDKLLSGQRPKAQTIDLKGETILAQLIWGAMLADFASIYAAILNNVDPTPVVLIEKLKVELDS